ncbi:UNVERIFIED_CONTAM: F-box/kelch-repeat protein [Sesamum radiatum]|uniref:F-box/kelch-repeat protein n=1 Tax=Sesamum radiatum TaxID=300843 RepID=A0AAW2KTD1_SESRA
MAAETSWVNHCFDNSANETVEYESFSEINDETEKEAAAAVSLDLILPDDLLERILAYLPIASIFRAGCVCKRWHDIVTSERFLWNSRLKSLGTLCSRARMNQLVMLMIRSSESGTALTSPAFRHPIGSSPRHVG